MKNKCRLIGLVVIAAVLWGMTMLIRHQTQSSWILALLVTLVATGTGEFVGVGIDDAHGDPEWLAFKIVLYGVLSQIVGGIVFLVVLAILVVGEIIVPSADQGNGLLRYWVGGVLMAEVFGLACYLAPRHLRETGGAHE